MNLKNLLALAVSVLGVTVLTYGVYSNFQYARKSPPSSAQENPITYPESSIEPSPTAQATQTPTQAPTIAPTTNTIAQPTASPTTTPSSSSQKQGDITNDNKVNIFDLSALLNKWGTDDSAADLNDNGKVDIYDLSILLKKWEN